MRVHQEVDTFVHHGMRVHQDIASEFRRLAAFFCTHAAFFNHGTDCPPTSKASGGGVNHPRPKERMASQHRNCTRAVVHAATSAPVSFESTRPRLGAQKSGEFAFAGKSSICLVVMTGEMNRDRSSHFIFSAYCRRLATLQRRKIELDRARIPRPRGARMQRPRRFIAVDATRIQTRHMNGTKTTAACRFDRCAPTDLSIVSKNLRENDKNQCAHRNDPKHDRGTEARDHRLDNTAHTHTHTHIHTHRHRHTHTHTHTLTHTHSRAQ